MPLETPLFASVVAPELTIEKLFTQPIQKPFSYDLKLGQKEEQTQESAE